MDRSITVRMRRKTPEEKVSKLRARKLKPIAAPLASRCARWALDHGEAVREAEPEMPPGLDDRAEDCWEPLLAIADLAGGDWPQRAREAAGLLSNTRDGDAASHRIRLLPTRRTSGVP